MTRASSQLAPPLVVRVNSVGPRKTGPVVASRSHTAYTKRESLGSAVIEPLSLKRLGLASRMSVEGLLQVSPPSVDLDTSMASGLKSPRALGSWSTDKLIR